MIVAWLAALLFVAVVYGIVMTILNRMAIREAQASLACAAYWWNRWRTKESGASREAGLLRPIKIRGHTR